MTWNLKWWDHRHYHSHHLSLHRLQMKINIRKTRPKKKKKSIYKSIHAHHGLIKIDSSESLLRFIIRPVNKYYKPLKSEKILFIQPISQIKTALLPHSPKTQKTIITITVTQVETHSTSKPTRTSEEIIYIIRFPSFWR